MEINGKLAAVAPADGIPHGPRRRALRGIPVPHKVTGSPPRATVRILNALGTMQIFLQIVLAMNEERTHGKSSVKPKNGKQPNGLLGTLTIPTRKVPALVASR